MFVVFSLLSLLYSTFLLAFNKVSCNTSLCFVSLAGTLSLCSLVLTVQDGFWYLSWASINRDDSFFGLGSILISSSWWGDWVSNVIFLVILFVSFFVLYFSSSYLLSDNHASTYTVRLLVFVCAMSMLVFSNHLWILFFSWEIIGLTSFALIGFWYTRMSALNGSLKAILLNRLGDLSFIFCLSLGCYFLGDVSLSLLSLYATWIFSREMYWFVLFFTFAGIVKSAQIWMHLWLVDAMEAPTPTSALLHAATMVIAGVYLIIRIHPLILLTSPLVGYIMLSIFTMLFASLVALCHTDLKKIIAYSTSSHVAYMFLASFCSLNSFYHSSLYHLLAHACFKSLLFISAGLLIHSFLHIQDMRYFSNVSSMFPFFCIAIFLSTFPVLPIPFLSSFYSKHFVLFSLISFSPVFLSAFVFFLLATVLSILYTMRLLYFLCFNPYRVTWPVFLRLNE